MQFFVAQQLILRPPSYEGTLPGNNVAQAGEVASVDSDGPSPLTD